MKKSISYWAFAGGLEGTKGIRAAMAEAAQQMIPYANIPTEKHILWILNRAIPSHESTRRYLAEVIAFWHGLGR